MRKARKLDVLVQLGLTARAGRTALSAELGTLGLYSGQDAVLLALADSGGLTLRDLASRLQVKPPTITKTIARLSTHGIVEKRASQNDGRQSSAHLTQKGFDLVAEIKLAQATTAATAFAGIGKRDRRTLVKLLGRIEHNLVASGRDPPGDTVADEPDTLLHGADHSD